MIVSQKVVSGSEDNNITNVTKSRQYQNVYLWVAEKSKKVLVKNHVTALSHVKKVSNAMPIKIEHKHRDT